MLDTSRIIASAACWVGRIEARNADANEYPDEREILTHFSFFGLGQHNTAFWPMLGWTYSLRRS